MNNEQLFQLFQSIDKHTNCFDRAIALKKAKKEYKRSDFYKQTHYSIQVAYKIYNANAINTISAFLNSRVVQCLSRGNYAALQVELEEFIGGIDLTKLDYILDYIGMKLDSLVENKDQVQNKLEEMLNNFQSSLQN